MGVTYFFEHRLQFYKVGVVNSNNKLRAPLKIRKTSGRKINPPSPLYKGKITPPPCKGGWGDLNIFIVIYFHPNIFKETEMNYDLVGIGNALVDLGPSRSTLCGLER